MSSSSSSSSSSRRMSTRASTKIAQKQVAMESSSVKKGRGRPRKQADVEMTNEAIVRTTSPKASKTPKAPKVSSLFEQLLPCLDVRAEDFDVTVQEAKLVGDDGDGDVEGEAEVETIAEGVEVGEGVNVSDGVEDDVIASVEAPIEGENVERVEQVERVAMISERRPIHTWPPVDAFYERINTSGSSLLMWHRSINPSTKLEIKKEMLVEYLREQDQIALNAARKKDDPVYVSWLEALNTLPCFLGDAMMSVSELLFVAPQDVKRRWIKFDRQGDPLSALDVPWKLERSLTKMLKDVLPNEVLQSPNAIDMILNHCGQTVYGFNRDASSNQASVLGGAFDAVTFETSHTSDALKDSRKRRWEQMDETPDGEGLDQDSMSMAVASPCVCLGISCWPQPQGDWDELCELKSVEMEMAATLTTTTNAEVAEVADASLLRVTNPFVPHSAESHRQDMKYWATKVSPEGRILKRRKTKIEETDEEVFNKVACSPLNGGILDQLVGVKTTSRSSDGFDLSEAPPKESLLWFHTNLMVLNAPMGEWNDCEDKLGAFASLNDMLTQVDGWIEDMEDAMEKFHGFVVDDDSTEVKWKSLCDECAHFRDANLAHAKRRVPAKIGQMYDEVERYYKISGTTRVPYQLLLRLHALRDAMDHSLKRMKKQRYLGNVLFFGGLVMRLYNSGLALWTANVCNHQVDTVWAPCALSNPYYALIELCQNVWNQHLTKVAQARPLRIVSSSSSSSDVSTSDLEEEWEPLPHSNHHHHHDQQPCKPLTLHYDMEVESRSYARQQRWKLGYNRFGRAIDDPDHVMPCELVERYDCDLDNPGCCSPTRYTHPTSPTTSNYCPTSPGYGSFDAPVTPVTPLSGPASPASPASPCNKPSSPVATSLDELTL